MSKVKCQMPARSRNAGGSKKGFLLIEVILYLALFSLMMGGSISLFYQLLESNQDLSELSLQTQEAEFILGKVSWLLSDFKKIYSPSSEETSNVLSLLKHPDEFYILKEQNGEILLQRNNEEAVSLTNNRVKVSDLSFENLTAEGLDTAFIIKASFSIDGNEYFISRFNIAQ